MESLTTITSKPKDSIRVVCISDTHTLHKKIEVPDGDILIHAGNSGSFSPSEFRILGDFTCKSLPKEIKNFNTWLKSLPHKHKVVIAGNHEITFDSENYETDLKELVTFQLG